MYGPRSYLVMSFNLVHKLSNCIFQPLKLESRGITDPNEPRPASLNEGYDVDWAVQIQQITPFLGSSFIVLHLSNNPFPPLVSCSLNSNIVVEVVLAVSLSKWPRMSMTEARIIDLPGQSQILSALNEIVLIFCPCKISVN